MTPLQAWIFCITVIAVGLMTVVFKNPTSEFVMFVGGLIIFIAIFSGSLIIISIKPWKKGL